MIIASSSLTTRNNSLENIMKLILVVFVIVYCVHWSYCEQVWTQSNDHCHRSTVTPKISRDLSAALKEMADNLAPSRQLVSEVQRIINRLTIYLNDRRFRWSHSINRVVPVGSFAKKTSLRIMMDLDLIVYLNDIEYPFADFLGALHDHILLNDSYTNCSRSRLGLFFIAEGTLHVDLLPATNRIPRHGASGQRAQKLQHDNTLRFIMNSDNPSNAGWQQSTGVFETAVEFVKRKNEDFHVSTMTRLAKFWSKTVCVEEFHSGRSSIMEYIAIRATELEQSDTFRSFRRFLTIISKPEDMSIYWTDYYSDQDIEPSVKTERPLLLDPTNPYNSLLRGLNRGYMKEMARFAQVSLERLNGAECRASQGEQLDMLELFKPQPEWLELPFNTRRSSRKPGCFHVSVEDGRNLMMPKSTIKSQNINDQEREVIENFLFSFVEVSVVNWKKKGVNVADRVQRDVQDMIVPNTSCGSEPAPMSADAKLEIPFEDEDGRKKVLKIQFDMV